MEGELRIIGQTDCKSYCEFLIEFVICLFVTQ